MDKTGEGDKALNLPIIKTINHGNKNIGNIAISLYVDAW